MKQKEKEKKTIKIWNQKLYIYLFVFWAFYPVLGSLMLKVDIKKTSLEPEIAHRFDVGKISY